MYLFIYSDKFWKELWSQFRRKSNGEDSAGIEKRGGDAPMCCEEAAIDHPGVTSLGVITRVSSPRCHHLCVITQV